MRSYVISTDSSADLSEAYLKEHQITMISLSCILNGKIYNSENPITPKQLYDNIREGAMPTTSQVNPEQAKAAFEPLLKEGKDILHLAFSSGLSGSCQSARIAAEELQDEYPERKIVVIDTLLAALGQGLLVYKAAQLKEQGASMDEVADWCEKNKDYIASYVTVDDLFHLHRGGRVSKATAILGTMMNVKPVLHVDDEGHLIAVGKVRGRKKSISALVDRMAEQMNGFAAENDVVFISHGDCMEDVEYLERLIREKFGITEFLVNEVGPTIGAHSGPGTLAVFFVGEPR